MEDLSLAQSLFGNNQNFDSRPNANKVFMLVKDSTRIIELDFINRQTRYQRGKFSTNFPHNFQSVNGPSGQLYLVGGGDYNKDEESLYNIHEVQVNNGFNFVKRDSMKHPRHGHSAIWFGEKFIVVTGSRKEKNSSEVKCEMYNADIDIWWELPDLNLGRHYHSSCAFWDQKIFIFCGISNKTKKYVNSIEMYDHTQKKKWELIEPPKSVFSERQGCGVI